MYFAKVFVVFFALSSIFALKLDFENHEAVDLILNNFADKPNKQLFKVWHLIFSKPYSLDSKEAISRFKIFKSNLAYINDFNSKNNETKLGLNYFADLTFEEIFELINDKKIEQFHNDKKAESFEQTKKMIKQGNYNPEIIEAKRTYDPIDHSSAFLGARAQLFCRSSWAFSSAGAIEGNRAIAFSKKEYLSVQQLIDCNEANLGCDGGVPEYGFVYSKQYGLTSDNNYPFRSIHHSKCKQEKANNVVSKISSFDYCFAEKCSENDAYFEMLKRGPIATLIDTDIHFFFYKSGILKYKCDKPKHSIVVYGYGIENGVEYFAFRNSFSSLWGNKGNGKFKRDPNNHRSCFIEEYAWLPVPTQ